jgi:hypothetical protein
VATGTPEGVLLEAEDRATFTAQRARMPLTKRPKLVVSAAWRLASFGSARICQPTRPVRTNTPRSYIVRT